MNILVLYWISISTEGQKRCETNQRDLFWDDDRRRRTGRRAHRRPADADADFSCCASCESASTFPPKRLMWFSPAKTNARQHSRSLQQLQLHQLQPVELLAPGKNLVELNFEFHEYSYAAAVKSIAESAANFHALCYGIVLKRIFLNMYGMVDNNIIHRHRTLRRWRTEASKYLPVLPTSTSRERLAAASHVKLIVTSVTRSSMLLLPS